MSARKSRTDCTRSVRHQDAQALGTGLCEGGAHGTLTPTSHTKNKKKNFHIYRRFKVRWSPKCYEKSPPPFHKKCLLLQYQKKSHRPMWCTTPLAARKGCRATKKASLATARIAAQHVRSDIRGKRSDSLTSCPATSRTPATVSEQAA